MFKRNLLLFTIALTTSACLSSGNVMAATGPICQGATRVNVILGQLHEDPSEDGTVPPDVDVSAAENGTSAPYLEWNDLNTASESITVRCYNGTSIPVVKAYPATSLPTKCVLQAETLICT